MSPFAAPLKDDMNQHGHQSTNIETANFTTRVTRTAPRFGAVGLLGAGVNLLGLAFLYHVAHLPLIVASVLAAELAVVHNFALNDKWTFGCQRTSMARFGKFNLSSALGQAVNVGLVALFVACGVHYILADLAGIIVGGVSNLINSASWVWNGSNA